MGKLVPYNQFIVKRMKSDILLFIDKVLSPYIKIQPYQRRFLKDWERINEGLNERVKDSKTENKS